MTLYVGTSGWAYAEWKPGFYPANLPRKRWLEHYAVVLGAVEINATFYRMQEPSTFAKWIAAVPQEFHFSLKAHRVLSMRKDLALNEDRRAFLGDFLASAAPLGERLGAVLFSLPMHTQRDDESLGALLEGLPGSTRFAFDFRSATWDESAVQDAVAEGGATVCLSERDGKVPAALPPGPLAYVRLRAPRYDSGARTGWKHLLTNEAAERDVYAFVKHEGVAAGDPYSGVGLAQWLADA